MRILFPNYFLYQQLYEKLLHIMIIHPEMAIDGFDFKNIFCTELSFPFNYVNGGPLNTIDVKDYIDLRQMHKIADIDSPYCFYINCANPLLIPTDVYDSYTNHVLKSFQNGSNVIISGLDWYTQILKEKYPDYKFMASADYFYYNKEPEIQLYDAGFQCNNLNDLETLKSYKIPKNKIWMNLVLPCQNCNSYLECKKLDHKAQLMFSSTSAFMNCDKYNLSVLTPKEFQSFQNEGYKNYWLNFNGISAQDIKLHLQIFIDLLIKPEYAARAELILRGIDDD